MRKIFFTTFLSAFLQAVLYAQTLTSPTDYFGYEPGLDFTPHHKVVDYIKYLTNTSPNANLMPYGFTNEGRDLLLVAVSSAENLKSIESIKRNNLIAAGFETGEMVGKHLPIVWLSYNIHGNESVSTEAAMSVLFSLLSKDKPNSEKWLDDMVIIIDPCENPDGRDRYVNWYKQTLGNTNNVHSDAWEHHEPWPGGRFNHYLFDLNRDWAWQTQIESQQRKEMYYQFLPHVHVDLHEMGVNSPYFFGPSAEPFHQVITDWQREFHNIIGEYNSTAFDKENWLYFTKEVFDLFYPSYGDTWPTYQGAVGFTYEQGGSGRAGLGVITDIGDTLTLKDRLAHHYTASFSTIEAAYSQKEKLLQEFKAFFTDAINNGSGDYKSFVVSSSNDEDGIKALLQLLDNHKITYGKIGNLPRLRNIVAYDYQQNTTRSVTPKTDDIVISTLQPQGKMVRVLFEPKPVLVDSMTYDLTSWALPHIYNLEAYAYKENINPTANIDLSFTQNTPASDKPYAYYFPWKDFKDAQLLANLLEAGIKTRYALEPFSIADKSFERGTIIVTRLDNSNFANFDATITTLANTHQQPIFTSNTGLVSSGKDLGSSYVRFIKPPKVAIINGEGVSPTAFGEVWHYFEEQLGYAVTVINAASVYDVDLNNYDVLILPNGRYAKYSGLITDFVDLGGKVIALERAINIFTADAGTLIGQSMVEKEDKASEEKAESLLKKYGDRNRKALSESVEGSIYKISLDDTHPLAFGAGKHTFLMKRNNTTLPFLGDGGWNVGVFKEDSYTSGFTGYKLQEKIKNTLAIGIESYGDGTIIYMSDSPIIRGFWHSGKLLLANAVFLSVQ
ncbi:MAG: M14 family metallopeptidase [Bacteroidota bacterium]